VDSRDDMWPWFQQVIAAVDRVHGNRTLERFWRKGTLVVNPAGGHPYQELIPQEFASRTRWFLLDTDATPPRPWKLTTPIPVWSLALELGQQPNRQWLVYAHAPLGDRTGTKVTLPGFGQVTIDATVAGTFVVVHEQDRRTSGVE